MEKLRKSIQQEKEQLMKKIEELQSCKEALASALEGEEGTKIQVILQTAILRMQGLSRELEHQEKRLELFR